jgi:hypothetical protein
MLLRRILKDEATGGRKKLHSDDLHNLLGNAVTVYCYGDQIEEEERGRTYSTHGKQMGSIFWFENVVRRCYLEDLGVDVTIMRVILRK